jgi:pimeloyl-ACP methyl ester carboxylesterase
MTKRPPECRTGPKRTDTAGAKGQPHTTLTGGHFLQEDSPVEFAGAVNSLLARLDESDQT